MTTIKMNEQISFMRKQKGLTQEEVATALGISNQAASKWEHAQCCPDIHLLPALAKLFNVSIDELMGYKAADSFENMYLKIKSFLKSSPEGTIFRNVFRLTVLLHEAACSHRYNDYVPWDTDKNLGLEGLPQQSPQT